MSTPSNDERVYMAEIVQELQRHRSTVVTWDDLGWLPPELCFRRDARNRRYWTPEQLEIARTWVNSPTRRKSPKSISSSAS